MAKKKRQPIRLSPAQMVQPDLDGGVELAPQAVDVQSESQTVDLREEYQYVIADLQRIGIIAVVMLTLLIVLALVLI